MLNAAQPSASQPMVAIFAMIAAQIGINLGAALGKDLFPLVGPEGVAALRTGISALILLALTAVPVGSVDRVEVAWLLPYGLSLGGMNLLFYWSIETIPLGVAAAIEICGPLAVVLLTSRTRGDFLWSTLAVGALLLMLPWHNLSDRLDLNGIMFALGAAFCWAIYILCGKKVSRAGSRAAVAFGMCVACLVTLPFGILSNGINLFSGQVIALGCAVALLSSALPYLLEMKALERLSSRVFGAITSSAPAVAALVGFTLLGEKLDAAHWAAICLMIVSSAGCSLSAKQPELRRNVQGI